MKYSDKTQYKVGDILVKRKGRVSTNFKYISEVKIIEVDNFGHYRPPTYMVKILESPRRYEIGMELMLIESIHDFELKSIDNYEIF